MARQVPDRAAPDLRREQGAHIGGLRRKIHDIYTDICRDASQAEAGEPDANLEIW